MFCDGDARAVVADLRGPPGITINDFMASELYKIGARGHSTQLTKTILGKNADKYTYNSAFIKEMFY